MLINYLIFCFNSPVAETEDKSDASINTFDKERAPLNVRTEEEETIRITLPRKKQKTTSYRQVDFFTTKDLPLSPKSTKKYVGSLKIQLNSKVAKEADCTVTQVNSKQTHSFKSLETSNKVKVQAEHEKGTLSRMEVQASEVDLSKIKKNAPTENDIKQKTDINQGTSDLALPLPNISTELQQKEMEVKEISLVSVQQFETTRSEVKKDIPAKSTKEQEPSLNAAVSEPVQQNTPKMQSQDTEVKETVLPQKVKTSQVTVSNIENIPVEIVSEKKLTPVPETGGFSQPVQKNPLALQDRDSEIKDLTLLQTVELSNSTVYKTKEDSHGSDANETKKCSSAAAERFSQPEEQRMLTVQTVDHEVKETISAHRVELSKSLVAEVKSEAPTIDASEQKPSLDVTANELIPPLLSSTPKLQHKEMEVRNAMKEKFSSTHFAPGASSSKEQRIHLREKSSFAWPEQSEIESQLWKAEVKEAIVFQNPQTSEATGFEIKDVFTKECVGQSIILGSPEADFPSSEEQIQLKSQGEENVNVSSNETSNLDSSSDMESFTESIRKYGSPISLPQKKQRIPKLSLMPPFAMPPIQEDFIPPKEKKIFDPTSFKFGLGKTGSQKGKGPSSVLKKQQGEAKAKLKKRASAEQSVVYKSLTINKSPNLRLHRPKDVEHNLCGDLHSKKFPLEIDQTVADASKSSTGAQIKDIKFTPSLKLYGVIVTQFILQLIIYNQPNFRGETIEIFNDVKDATSWNLPSAFSIRTVRGCWFLYQKPDFEGAKILLEEGAVELANIWGEEIAEDNNEEGPTVIPTVIGSIRRAVKDWSLTELDLFTEFNGMGDRTTFYDEIEKISTFGIPLSTLSMQVHSGIWLVFEEPLYHGNSYMVEPGQYACPEAWGGVEPFIASLKPVKMGGLKVENPNAGKIIVYEKPFFEGKQMELETDVFCFIGEAERDKESTLCQTYHFETVGSIKVLGGLWVGYEKSGFEGHQYLLEEGEYREWNEWGGYDEQLRSLQFIEVEASSPVMILFTETNFGEKGANIEVLGPILNLRDTEYGLKTQSINVLSGVWVAYEEADFTGAQYILGKGLYSSYQDWGAKDFRISSLQPVLVVSLNFTIVFFSETEFQGTTHVFEKDTVQFMDEFSPKSCKVLSGNWVVYDGEDFTGKQYVLEEGMYPNLITMGCATDTHIKSSKTVGFNFTQSNIELFERTDFKGKKIELHSEALNLALFGYNTHIFSVQVNGGTWIAYEFSNYRGCQILLQPGDIPNWHEFTGWHRIGSVRPLIQKLVYFRIRNRSTGALMTFTGELNDLKLVRVQALEPTGLDDQIWSYQDGVIKNKLAEDCCLDVVGSLITTGSRLGVSVLQNKDVHLWRFLPNGTIFSDQTTIWESPVQCNQALLWAN
uniref:Beta/gamma crystallin 'Greek key' domain-containing protein n=1 Tax=Callorhinchus milii TaxID=7868 RepID=A0A4W3HRI4_CALMI